MNATLLLYTQNDLVLEALASGRRSSFKKRASRRAWTVGFGQQLFASHLEQTISIFHWLLWYYQHFYPQSQHKSFWFFVCFFRLFHCASEELELALWLWNYNSALVFLNEDILFLYGFMFYCQWITFSVNLQRHIPGHKVPDL